MSLPDTIFIFALALIIFGPKKLPEIGRQIGKLVGEFRRASNEFKYQIEEELRQADLMEKPAAARPAPIQAFDRPIFSEQVREAAENLPAGQHPNIDTLNPAELNAGEALWSAPGTATAEPAAVPELPSTTSDSPLITNRTALPTITAAVGAQARTAVPFAPAIPAETNAGEPATIAPASVETEIAHG